MRPASISSTDNNDNCHQNTVPNIVEIRKDKGFVNIKSYGNDILGVLSGELSNVVQSYILPQELLIVGHLNDDRDIECILKVLAKDEGDQVAQVQGVGRRTAACVQVKLLSALVQIQNTAQVSILVS
jgi:hypothetical protein